jgi:nucleolar protein 56
METVTWFGRVDPETGKLLPAEDMNNMINNLMSFCTAHPQEGPRPDLRHLALSSGFAKSDQEYNALLREVSLALVKRKLDSHAGEEAEMLQMIEALDVLDQAINLLEERLYEWSILRGRYPRGHGLAELLSGQEGIGELAKAISGLHGRRESLEEKVGLKAMALAPNLSSLAGSLLAARLVSRAGSLRRLAELPASTIQIIGAEKALFKHLRGKAPSPKHGILYRHPLVSGAPRKLRGKTSRALAGKLAIAARVDYHSQVMMPELKQSLDKRLSEIRKTRRQKLD